MPSSKKAHRGSAKATNPKKQASSITTTTHYTTQHKYSTSQYQLDYSVNRFEDEPRDVRSHVVSAYDAHQEVAKDRHWEGLEEVVGGKY